MHPALNMTGPSPVCCHFLFSVPCDGVTADDLGVGDVFPSGTNSLSVESSAEHISGNSFMLVLLSPPIAGSGGWANTIQFLAFWG